MARGDQRIIMHDDDPGDPIEELLQFFRDLDNNNMDIKRLEILWKEIGGFEITLEYKYTL